MSEAIPWNPPTGSFGLAFDLISFRKAQKRALDGILSNSMTPHGLLHDMTTIGGTSVFHRTACLSFAGLRPAVNEVRRLRPGSDI